MLKRLAVKLNDKVKYAAFGPVRISVGLFLVGIAAGLIALNLKHWRSGDNVFCAYACLLAMAWIVARGWLSFRGKIEKTAYTLLLLALLGTVGYVNHYQRTVTMYEKTVIRTWNMYHYYIGSKYFDELGYKDLYLHTLLADRQDKKRLKSIKHVRDLTDYRTKQVAKILPDKKSDRWTKQRWRMFKKDLRVFLARAGNKAWSRMLRDRGYNPTPFWNTIGSWISHKLDVKQKGQLLFAVSIDFILYAVMLGVAIWAFGLEAAMLMFLAFLLLPFNIPRIVGGYIQYDWMAGIVAGICFVKKRRPIAAAISMGFATMVRVFPLIITAGLGVPALRKLLLYRKLEKFYLVFGIVFAAFIVFGIFLGSLSAYGLDGWKMFKNNIGIHNHEMSFGEGRVGLKHIFIHKIGSSHWETPDQRKKAYPPQAKYYYLAAAFFLLMFLPALALQDDVNAMIFAMILMFILLVPSHYYWSVLAVFVFWQNDREGPWRPVLIPSLTAFIVPFGWFIYAQKQPVQLAQYVRFDLLLAGCLLIFMGWVLIKAFIAYKKGELLKEGSTGAENQR